jgi:hypothetical protein
MHPRVAHLHTYFLFPFALDKQALRADHQDIWTKNSYWIDGLDEWIAAHARRGQSRIVDRLGGWRRTPYSRSDMDSPAYQDMVFFHPFVRRVFFDISDATGASRREALLRCYTIGLRGKQLFFEARDAKERAASVAVTDLRLFIFANGIAILSIGVEAFGLEARDALWINESMRKIYPSSGRQVREGRAPNYLAWTIEMDGAREVLAEERFARGEMTGYLPPLANTITSLLYFADYSRQEYEPVLDERMIVDTYVAIDAASVPGDYLDSEAYQVLLSRFLYVDRWGPDFRYDRAFLQRELERQLYTRWAHQGTYYGFTSYSSLTCCIGVFDCDEHQLSEGFLIHRMFDGRYYLMTLVALFYRATLLDFAERTALVSKRLFQDQEQGRITHEDIRLANHLRGDFLHFSNYWYFGELANKDEEIEHFAMQRREYGIEEMKAEIEEEVDKLNASLHNYYQFRSTESINRLAMLSLLFGAGAVLTGYFGMNFEGEFGRLFFQVTRPAFHTAVVVLVSLLAFGALSFGVFLVAANWQDYRGILLPRVGRQDGGTSLKRGG